MEEVAAPSRDVCATIELINVERNKRPGRPGIRWMPKGSEYSKSKGHEFIVLPKEEDERRRKLCLSRQDEYAAQMKQSDIPGEEALNFCFDWLSKSRYSNNVTEFRGIISKGREDAQRQTSVDQVFKRLRNKTPEKTGPIIIPVN